MKTRNLTYFFILLFFCFAAMSSRSQCTPASPDECPDPENNGQVCPDSLAAARLGQFYSEVATIKPPAIYFMEDSTEIPLHHVKLMQVGNVPPGLTWQSNTTDSIFTAGEYYCVLLEGTTDLAGDYPLRIVVDVYAVILPGWPAIKVATVTDSTSLVIAVVDDAAINESAYPELFVRRNIPNPFQLDTRIDFHSEISGKVDFEVYSLLGQKVYFQQVNAFKGENSLVFNGQMLPEGPYFYIFRSSGYKSTGIMIRKD